MTTATPLSPDSLVRLLRATGFDYTEDIWWREDDQGDLRVFVNISDVFAWGMADLEEITEENLQSLLDTYAEAEAVTGRHRATWASGLFAARQRQMRPQGAYVNLAQGDEHGQWWRDQFMAAGAERETGIGNPHDVRGN